MAGADTVIIRQTATTELTARDLGVQLSGEYDENQAAILLAFAREVEGCYKAPGNSWPLQCRMICNKLTDDECEDIAAVLETLLSHLRAIPRERAEEKESS